MNVTRAVAAARSAIRAPTQREMHTALENRFRKLAIMHHVAQRRQRFVRGEQNRPPVQRNMILNQLS